MPETVELPDAQASFSDLVDRAAAGEEIIIAVDGVPRARLIPLAEEQPLRRPGGLRGQIWVADDFDDPLPPEILRGFYGEDYEEPA
jgi:prevent-host-death family protein